MQKNVDTALLLGSQFGPRYQSNNPYNSDTQEQYFARRTKMFNAERLKWASNVVTAQVQGLNYNDFYAYTQASIRTANLIDPTTGKNLGSDWQRMIVMDMNIDFLPRGAKVVFNGNTWLVMNPMNVQSITGTSVIRRCNAIWNYLDEYGNVQSEPFCFGQGAEDLATTNNIQEQMTLMNGYQHCAMQFNTATSVLHHNYRMILGAQAYSVRGLQNFVLEFSEDADSTHIQFFDLQITEPLSSDDMQQKIADAASSQDKTPSVPPSPSKDGLVWIQAPPSTLSAYTTTIISAAVMQDGEDTQRLVSWSFEGPEKQAYTATTNDNQATIQCWQESPSPLVVTVSADGQTLSTKISLLGW